jgi:hypothetical protein
LGTDIFVGEALGQRHVFHVFHYSDSPGWAFDAFDPGVDAVDDGQQDVTWCVTSQVADEHLAHTRSPRRGGLIGAAQLQGMLRDNPAVAREQLKLRLAGPRRRHRRSRVSADLANRLAPDR